MPKPKLEAALDPWIIEEIRRREQDRKDEHDRPTVHIEVPTYDEPERKKQEKNNRPSDRGVVEVDYSINNGIEGY